MLEILGTHPTSPDAPNLRISRLLDQLTSHRGRPLFLPNLCSIAIDATEQSLRMLRWRCMPHTSVDPPPLKTVILYVKTPFDPDALFAYQIKSLRETGLEVALQEMDFYGADELRADFEGRECAEMMSGENEDGDFRMESDEEL
ncbi:hypothetical protein DFH09DRAFT_1321338 [Mycena vulgaris]|nr:hypothetical protein DFH09DRAFT_1321338 [Mycena vulgaris]